MSSNTVQSVGLILCSSRQPWICPQVAEFVKSSISTSPDAPQSNLHTIDLGLVNLPFFDEPGIPSRMKDPSTYIHEHTHAWSQEIQKHAAIIFVTPQYNWGYPAVIKNAIDFLYNEWQGKPAMVVSYGGHGGGEAASQLRQVLQHGVKMRVAETMPALEFGGRENVVKATKGEKIDVGVWDGKKQDVRRAYEEMMALISSIP